MGIGGGRGCGCGATMRGGDGQLEAVAYDICMTIGSVILLILSGLVIFNFSFLLHTQNNL